MFKLLALVSADLPVHCMRSQVLGEWTFTIGEASKDRSSCGHQRPDMEEHQPALSVTNGKDVTVTFVDRGENKVIAQHDGKESYFSMIYDEGFEFDLDDRSFVAFSGFTGVTGSNHSECGRTQVGWYSTKDRSQYGCFFGKKKGFEPYHALDQKVVRRASADNATEAANASKPVSRAEHAKKVALINERATTWRAKVYESYIEMSQQDLNRRAGHRRCPRPSTGATWTARTTWSRPWTRRTAARATPSRRCACSTRATASSAARSIIGPRSSSRSPSRSSARSTTRAARAASPA